MTISNVILTEGILFFKDSKKLYKLALKVESKLHKAKKEHDKFILNQTVEKIRFAALQFEVLEKKYSSNKKIVKEEYKKLHTEYVEIFNYIKKETVKKVLISVGVFSFVSAIMLLGMEKLDRFLVDNNILLSRGSESMFPDIKTTYTNSGLRKMVAEICKKENLSYKLISSIIDKESEWNQNAIHHNNNGSSDYGLMQLNSSNKKMFEQFFWKSPEKFDIKNPEHNAIVGIRYFKALLSQYKYDVKKALTAYNAGDTAVSTGNIPSSTLQYRSDIIKSFKS